MHPKNPHWETPVKAGLESSQKVRPLSFCTIPKRICRCSVLVGWFSMMTRMILFEGQIITFSFYSVTGKASQSIAHGRQEQAQLPSKTTNHPMLLWSGYTRTIDGSYLEICLGIAMYTTFHCFNALPFRKRGSRLWKSPFPIPVTPGVYSRGDVFSPTLFLYMGGSKNSGFSPQIIHFNRVFHYFHHPVWDTPVFGNTLSLDFFLLDLSHQNTDPFEWKKHKLSRLSHKIK